MATSNATGPDTGLDNPLIYLSTEFIRAKEYLEAIVASTSDAICTTDMQGRLIYVSPGAETMFGLSFRELMGKYAWRLYRGGRAEAESIMRRLVDEGSISDYETVVRRPDGRTIHISMSASLIRDRRGSLLGTLGISKDISRRVELEQRLRALTVTDDLTGLLNQRCFHERMAIEVQRASRQSSKLSLLLVDLDRFKDANDTWGHVEGDRILQDASRILLDSVRRDVDLAFRVGGDEFTVLLPGLGHRHAEAVARRVRSTARRRPYGSLVTFSVGVASLRKGDRPEDLLRRADERMYRQKRSGRRR